MYNPYLAHELAKERMHSAVREAQRARKRISARQAKDKGLWLTFWRMITHPWQAFGSLAEGPAVPRRG